MIKVIEIEENKIPFMSTGETLRLYRTYFQRDMLQDLVRLNKFESDTEQAENFDFAIIENLAWICAKTATPTIPDIGEWLAQFDSPLSLYGEAKVLFELLTNSMKTIVTSKKKAPKKVK